MLVRKGLSEYNYLLMLMRMRPGDWDNKLERMNMRSDEKNGRAVGMVRGRDWKFWRFSSNEFWNNIHCIVSDPAFGIGWSRIWEKEEAHNIIGKKRNRFYMREKVDLFEVYVYPILFIVLFIIL